MSEHSVVSKLRRRRSVGLRQPYWRLRYNCRSGGSSLAAFTMFGGGIVAMTGRV